MFGNQNSEQGLTLFVKAASVETQHLTAVVAAEHANVVQVVHDRAYFGAHLGEGVVDITMETRGPEHVEELTGKLREAGYALEQVR